MTLFAVDDEPEPVASNWNPFGDEFEVPAGADDDHENGRRKPRFNAYNGRYNDLPPVPGFEHVKTWTRVTTLKSTLEDQWRLDAWKRRQVFMGIKYDPKILGEITPQLDPTTRFGKKRLDQLTDRAIAVAGSHEGRDRGSELHEILERDQDGTLDLDTLDDDHRLWLDGYHNALTDHGVRFLPEYSERVVVIPELGCAGTLDTLADDNGTIKVGDLKSQKWLPGQFDSISLCIQLACYANAAFMLDDESWTWENVPQIDRTKGVVLWAPAVKPGEAQIIDVDLEFGWEMALLSKEVRQHRNRKGVVTRRMP